MIKFLQIIFQGADFFFGRFPGLLFQLMGSFYVTKIDASWLKLTCMLHWTGRWPRDKFMVVLDTQSLSLIFWRFFRVEQLKAVCLRCWLNMWSSGRRVLQDLLSQAAVRSFSLTPAQVSVSAQFNQTSIKLCQSVKLLRPRHVCTLSSTSISSSKC